MFLKNLQMNRRSVFSTLIIISQVAFFARTFALDLKIDLPPDEGLQPVLYYNPITNQKAESELKRAPKSATENSKNNQNNKENRIVISANSINQNNNNFDIPPPPPSLEIKATKKNTKLSSLQNKRQVKDFTSTKKISKIEENFPMIPCIIHNVNFWKKVYTEIDSNEAFIHDKESLNRVYAKIKIPQNPQIRTQFVKNEREKYIALLDSLSKKLKTPKKWTFQEKKIAKLFNKGELTQKNLLLAKDNIRFQSGLKTQFEEGIQRSINFMPTIFPEIKSSGLPLDLAYLPHVESSFNSKAGSKVGAMGLWQIMPGTMRHIEGDEAVSKRTDPKVSTRVAMKILKADYEKIQSWPLTLTAYNHGVNGVLRAISETGSRDLCKIIDHYDSPSFKFASTNFYAQFLAARKVAMQRYLVLAKKGDSRKVLKRTLLSSQGGKLK
ncbi:lytic transglycosylase domain-containing protein [Fluviispira multicolorata]|uniref:Transglycosylase SLT domain-containing protein n=1 Tax=Fluviispira multicolorata TaxID=2654512 RepID=A0A833N184_9BACT|nr:lytic transglycosylase domain-containing protein [Fluviispira multicolorata]KAB8030000.1 transglycosylase SLT domain-containing protein [Fluviispira multicolorata]